MNAQARQERAHRLEELRVKLHAQRLLIIGQLGTQVDGAGGIFPRSATLRLLGRRPELVASTLGLFLSLFRSR
ncbi:MAG: hypothetical protein RL684_1085 [Pseudomonadota bacterium]